MVPGLARVGPEALGEGGEAGPQAALDRAGVNLKSEFSALQSSIERGTITDTGHFFTSCTLKNIASLTLSQGPLNVFIG